MKYPSSLYTVTDQNPSTRTGAATSLTDQLPSSVGNASAESMANAQNTTDR